MVQLTQSMNASFTVDSTRYHSAPTQRRQRRQRLSCSAANKQALLNPAELLTSREQQFRLADGGQHHYGRLRRSGDDRRRVACA